MVQLFSKTITAGEVTAKPRF